MAANPSDKGAQDVLEEIEALLRVEAAGPDSETETRASEEDARLRRLLEENATDITALVAVGDREFTKGFYRRALRIFDRAEAACRSSAGPGPNSPTHLSVQYRRAQALIFAGHAAEAEAALADLLPVRERVNGKEHPDTLTTRFTLTQAQLDQGRAAEAEAALAELLPVRQRINGKEHPGTLTTRFTLARAQLNQGRAAEAEAALADLLPVEERVKGSEHPDIFATRISHVLSLFEDGRPDTARAVFDESSMQIPESPVSRARYHLVQAIARDSNGDTKAAEAALDQAEVALPEWITPDHFMRRHIAEYRLTRTPGKAGGTTLWMIAEPPDPG